MAEEKKNRVGRDLTVGPIMPMLLSFAAPMVLATVIQQIYGMVDLAIIGKFVGSIGTVGVSTGGELSDVMTPIASSFSMAGQIYIAQLVGAKETDRTKSAIGTLLTMMSVVALIFTTAAVVFYRQILEALNCPEEAFSAAASYMLITAAGMPFIFGYNAICAILRSMGESKRPLMFVLVAATVNIFLDLLLVVVIPLEAAGTAIATVASQIGAFAAAFSYLYKRREQFGIRLERSYFRVNSHDFFVIIKLGIPQMIRTMSVQGSMLWVKANINAYGLIVSSTYSVGNKIEKFINIFIQGVDGAGGAMIGQNLGAKKTDRVYGIMKNMFIISLLVGAAGSVLFLTCPTFLYSLFTSDQAVVEYGRVFLRIMALGCIVVGFSGAAKSISTGAGAAGLSLIIGVLDGVTRIAVCLIAFHIFRQGQESYFWGAALCQLIPGIVAFTYFISGKWKTKKLL